MSAVRSNRLRTRISIATWALADMACTRCASVAPARLSSRFAVSAENAALVLAMSVVVPDSCPSKLSTSHTDSSDFSVSRLSVTCCICGNKRRSGGLALMVLLAVMGISNLR